MNLCDRCEEEAECLWSDEPHETCEYFEGDLDGEIND